MLAPRGFVYCDEVFESGVTSKQNISCSISHGEDGAQARERFARCSGLGRAMSPIGLGTARLVGCGCLPQGYVEVASNVAVVASKPFQSFRARLIGLLRLRAQTYDAARCSPGLFEPARWRTLNNIRLTIASSSRPEKHHAACVPGRVEELRREVVRVMARAVVYVGGRAFRFRVFQAGQGES